MRDSTCLKAVATIQSKMGSVDSLSELMCESNYWRVRSFCNIVSYN